MNILKKFFAKAIEPIMMSLQSSVGWTDVLTSNMPANNVINSLQSSPIAAAHRIFCNSLAQLPIKVYKKTETGREVLKHNLDFVLSIRATKNQSPFIVRRFLASQAFWYGWSAAYINRNAKGVVEEIIPLRTDYALGVFEDNDGNVYYKWNYNNSIVTFMQDELLLYFFETVDGLTGKGMLNIAKETIATDRMAQSYNSKFYKNGAKLSGVLEVPDALNDDKKEVIRKGFERAVNNDNAYRVAIIDLGMKYTPLGISQKDAQFIESRNFNVEEVSRYTGIPLYMLQSGKQAYSSNEQQGIDFVTNTLQPHVIQMEQEHTYKLLTNQELKNDLYIRMNMAALMRGDNESRAKFYESMFRCGSLSINEIRQSEEKNTIPNGDMYFVTKNYMTLDEAAKGGDKNAV